MLIRRDVGRAIGTGIPHPNDVLERIIEREGPGKLLKSLAIDMNAEFKGLCICIRGANMSISVARSSSSSSTILCGCSLIIMTLPPRCGEVYDMGDWSGGDHAARHMCSIR